MTRLRTQCHRLWRRRPRAGYNYCFGKDGPPTYAKPRKWEAALPQHNLTLAFPEGKYGRHVRFSNQLRWLGWNNVFNDMCHTYTTALTSSRTTTYWAQEHYQWPPSTYVSYESRTPLPAIISGPGYIPTQHLRRLVGRGMRQCPLASHLPPTHQRTPSQEADPRRRLGTCCARGSKSYTMPQRAVSRGSPLTGKARTMGCRRCLICWFGAVRGCCRCGIPAFSASPISRLLGSSPMVREAVERNSVLFASYRSGFYGWVQFQHLPDRFDAETVGEKVFGR
ncbi:hypothetical protein FB45DRAFT_754889 [Roridomyces roridus]|uniref:Uncharacterized protein n=1 Tax=Roridomyces roridus TaxID=1738132 RepID=A0AAD7BH92_9AGAR|nr:hypothetical protein FB45DRAFT_754889 [Roridomyces roridus]